MSLEHKLNDEEDAAQGDLFHSSSSNRHSDSFLGNIRHACTSLYRAVTSPLGKIVSSLVFGTGLLCCAPDYASAKDLYPVHAASEPAQGSGLGADECVPEILTQVLEADTDKSVFSDVDVTVEACGRDDLELKVKTDIDGVTLLGVKNEGSLKIFSYHFAPRNYGLGVQNFRIRFELVDGEHAILDTLPKEGSGEDYKTITYLLREKIMTTEADGTKVETEVEGWLNPWIIVNPKLGYEYMTHQLFKFDSNMVAIPSHFMPGEWLELNFASSEVNTVVPWGELFFKSYSFSNGRTFLSTGLGLGAQLKENFRTVPVGGGVRVSYNNEDFSTYHNTDSGTVEIVVFGDELFVDPFSALFKDLEYEVAGGLSMKDNQHFYSFLRAGAGSFFDFSMIDIDGFGSLNLLGIYTDSQIKTSSTELPILDTLKYDSSRYDFWSESGLKMRAESGGFRFDLMFGFLLGACSNQYNGMFNIGLQIER